MRSRSASKLARALADLVPPAPVPLRKKQHRRATSGAAVVDHLARQVVELHEQDRRLRTSSAASVHQMRIAVRRLRSALKTYRSLFADAQADSLEQDLRWLGQALGPARDAQVLREHLHALVASEPPELVLGPVADLVDDELLPAEQVARKTAREALDSARYFRLLDALDEFVQSPTLTGAGEEPARQVFPRLLRRESDRLRRAVARADRAADEDRDVALHDVRKKAKRLRYAAESMAPALGKPATKLAASVKKIHECLGEHQDTVMTRRVLCDVGARAQVAGQNGFTFGRLHALEATRAEAAVGDFEHAWRRVQELQLRR